MARQQSSPTCVSLTCFWLGIWPSFIRARRALEEGRGRLGRRRRWVWRSSPRHLRRHAASDGSVCSASLNATEKNSRLRPPSPSCACVLGCDHGTREHARVRAGEARTRDGYDAAGTGERCGGAEARSYSEGACGGKHGRALEGQTWGADVDGHALTHSQFASGARRVGDDAGGSGVLLCTLWYRRAHVRRARSHPCTKAANCEGTRSVVN